MVYDWFVINDITCVYGIIEIRETTAKNAEVVRVVENPIFGEEVASGII
jgi:hypothetical protein